MDSGAGGFCSSMLLLLCHTNISFTLTIHAAVARERGMMLCERRTGIVRLNRDYND